jgi:hypothetical protein
LHGYSPHDVLEAGSLRPHGAYAGDDGLLGVVGHEVLAV